MQEKKLLDTSRVVYGNHDISYAAGLNGMMMMDDSRQRKGRGPEDEYVYQVEEFVDDLLVYPSFFLKAASLVYPPRDL